MQDKTFGINVQPLDFGDIVLPGADEYPQPNIKCGIHTDNCHGIVFAWPVPEKATMPYDSVEEDLSGVREFLSENMGIIECKNGITAMGHKYIYHILKILHKEDNVPFGEVSYTLNFNVNQNETHYFISASFTEIGITGQRDCFGAEVFRRDYLKEHGNAPTQEETQLEFYQDPYEKSFRKGFLMNRSEEEVFDPVFPGHPLSMLRKYVKWVIARN